METRISGNKALPLAGLLILAAGCGAAPADPAPPLRTADYSYVLWLNGWRTSRADFAWMRSPGGSPFVYPRLEGWKKTESGPGAAILAVETSRYDFSLNPSDFRKAGFAAGEKKPGGYAEALRRDTERLHHLPAAEVVIELETGGAVYRAIRCGGGARLWESGRFVQHYDFLDLEFQDAAGKTLSCRARLDLVAWPDSLTLTAVIAPAAGGPNPAAPPAWTPATLRVQLKGQAVDRKVEQAFDGKWGVGEEKSVSLRVPAAPIRPDADVSVAVSAAGDQAFPVTYRADKSCFVASVPKVKRAFKAGYTDVRGYDEFTITVDNRGAAATEVPFLLDFHDTANITGLVPILCDAQGRPTGLPVQLSKNWHMGSYLMAYSSLPARPGRTEYLLRIVYGFYGTAPSASHSQLSLVGWGGHGRWDQLAIGCWGETFCLDMDMTNIRTVIADVRMLMVRRGLKGVMWGWSDGQWGGDWLGMGAADGTKLAYGDLKTAYLAHGPCLSDVRYDGFYGAARDVALQARVQTLRTDDHARTFHTLKYTFGRRADADAVWLFKMGGGTSGYLTPTVAWGDRGGLVSQQTPRGNLKPGDVLVDRLTLSGAGPWWVAFPDANFTPAGLKQNTRWGTGGRSLIVRSYKATLGGKTYVNPTISLQANRVQAEGLDIDLLLKAPREVRAFQPGDTVEMSVEWITLPRAADDYYGPNETFRSHIAVNPASWKTTHREALANDLDVTVRGGKVLERYPIVIAADSPTVEVRLKGGAGFVPIRFEGLKSIDGVALYEVVGGREVKLDQAVRGNDFWQADYDEAAKTYKLTYNLPLDNKPESTWRLKPSR